LRRSLGDEDDADFGGEMQANSTLQLSDPSVVEKIIEIVQQSRKK
jgi:hypothetical protein